MSVSVERKSSVYTTNADLEGLLDLDRFLDHLTEPAALLGPDGQTVPLTIEIFELLCQVVKQMREGKAITLAPIDQKMTTQEAANFLGISRPSLVKLLEKGEIAFERTSGSRHRRLYLRDVVDYQENLSMKRRKALDALSRESAEKGYYKDLNPDYLNIVKAIRKELS